MRFAYIDSQGTEVPIPSVDALALRIELGAIGPDTELYDAQADRWGPAHTHEIFHTLSRKAEEEGFVAPPPPVAPPPGTPEPEEEEEEDVEADLVAEEPAEEPAAADEEVGLDFTLADTVDLEPAAEEPAEEEAAAETPGFAFDIESDLAGTAAPAEAVEEPEEEAAGAFDFGEFGSLELEGAEPEAEPASDELTMEEPAAEGLTLEEPAAADAGFEQSMDFTGGGDASGGLELEQPMSEFTPESPPAWMEQEGPAGADEGAMDFSQPATEERSAPARTSEEPERRERPTPRSRPSPPRRRRRFPTKTLFTLVLLGGAGYGGWYYWPVIWPMIQERLAAASREDVPTRPPVVIPDIPAELLPQMREIGHEALDGMIAEFQRLQRGFDLPAQPRNEWLAGIYLANASQYPDAQEYWLAIESFVDSVRSVDTELFHERYVRGVERARVPDETATLLVERADSGFLAAAEQRFEAYAQIEDLINASLDLHDFLLQNEEGIVYEPASAGLSRDPLLEAFAEDEGVSRRMGQHMSRITNALSALGTLDRVTTERLAAVLFDRILSAGFR